MSLHEGEMAVDAALVAQMVSELLPELAGLPVTRISTLGTVNAIFRIGDDWCARMPLTAGWADGIEREWQWLPRLGSLLPLGIPVPVALGPPSVDYPLPWSVLEWIKGSPATDSPIADDVRAAAHLADFVRALRSVPCWPGAPPAGRRPLAELGASTRQAIGLAPDLIDGPAVTSAWQRTLDGAPWDGAPVWIHGDLLPPNLLVHTGSLCAVLDFGGCGIGDPAMDVIPAWTTFGPAASGVFREVLQVDDDTWRRAAGIALHQAVMIIPYYRRSNPDFVTLARRTVDRILADDSI